MPGAEEQAALRAARLGAAEPCASHRYAKLFRLQGGAGKTENIRGEDYGIYIYIYVCIFIYDNNDNNSNNNNNLFIYIYMYVYWLVVTGTCLLLFHRLGLIIQLYFSEGLKPPTSLYIYIYI